jgi:hypothetical protein
VALDQVMSDGREGVYYWPSYEVVRWVGAHLPWPAYGLHNRKPRDVSKRIVAEIIDAFVEAYYTPEAVAQLRATARGSENGSKRQRARRALGGVFRK